MAQSKATRKFEKNHLKDTLKRRNEVAKVKQRHRLKDQKKARRAADQSNEAESADAAQGGAKAEGRQKGKAALEDMSVDDFFAGGFDVAKSMTEQAGSKRPGKRKRVTTQEDEDDASVASVEDHAAAAGAADGEDAVDDDDEMQIHKDELQALAKKDPEFYKYLQENDAELLDFSDRDPDLVDLSGEEDQASKDGAKGRKKKEDTNDVSAPMVKRWSTAMTEKHSLRAMREVVLAFRAAAHANDQNDKTYKYTIKDADGISLPRPSLHITPANVFSVP